MLACYFGITNGIFFDFFLLGIIIIQILWFSFVIIIVEEYKRKGKRFLNNSVLSIYKFKLLTL